VNKNYNLSPKQFECWVAIAKYMRENDGLSPAVDDLLEAANAHSRSTMQSRIDKLKECGLIKARRNVPRSIVLLQQPPEEAMR
jgi:SOS-response transcriptional repressor LexA